jgi:large subunit ribosomal protein L21
MYAVIRQGSHQYRVAPGDTIQIEKIEAEKGQIIEIEDVLLVANSEGQVEIGEPRVSGAVVKAKVTFLGIGENRGPKVDIYKFKRRKAFEKRAGHRQPYTQILITAVEKNGQPLS